MTVTRRKRNQQNKKHNRSCPIEKLNIFPVLLPTNSFIEEQMFRLFEKKNRTWKCFSNNFTTHSIWISYCDFPCRKRKKESFEIHVVCSAFPLVNDFDYKRMRDKMLKIYGMPFKNSRIRIVYVCREWRNTTNVCQICELFSFIWSILSSPFWIAEILWFE